MEKISVSQLRDEQIQTLNQFLYKNMKFMKKYQKEKVPVNAQENSAEHSYCHPLQIGNREEKYLSQLSNDITVLVRSSSSLSY